MPTMPTVRKLPRRCWHFVQGQVYQYQYSYRREAGRISIGHWQNYLLWISGTAGQSALKPYASITVLSQTRPAQLTQVQFYVHPEPITRNPVGWLNAGTW